MEALLAAILDAVFASLAESVGLSDWLRDQLRRDPEKLAFRLALTQALTDAGAQFPGRDVRYFAEILRDIGGPLLARTLQPASPFPTADELTQLWLNHLTIDSAIHYREDFVAFATLLLDQLNQHIENQQPLQWIIQARRQRSNEEVTRRLAEAAVQSAATLDALRQNVVGLSAALETVLKTGGSTVTMAGGAYVAGSVSAHHFAGRDLTIKNYFVAGLARLPTDYSVRIENFLFTYLGGNDERVPFGGRQQQLDELSNWVDDPAAPPYYLMVAEAGKGKSALVCRWSAQLATRPDLDVIFVPISIRFQTAAQDVFFGALAARLAQLHEKQAPDLFYKPNTSEEWKAACESYLRRPLPDGKRLVVIVDGLDETTDWLAGPELFAVRPPAGLRVLVTARLRAKESDALGWAATLNWEGPRLARKVTLPALDRQGVEEALASMGNPLDWLATQIDIVGKLYYLSEGDPLLVRLYVDELAKKKAQAAFLTPADLDTIQPGLAGFMQKWWEDQRKQWRMQKKDPHAEEERLLPLLSACAVAYGPLLLKDLAALDATHFGAARTVVNRAELLGRWLIGDGERQGYVFAHPRLREFFSGPTWLSDDEHAAWQTKFCDWGERVLADLNVGKLDPKQAPEYLLRNYATHLAQSAAPPECFYALISDGWRKAWEELDVSYGGFLNDVEQARERATQAYATQQFGQAEAVIQQLRAALCQSSVIALRNNMSPTLLVQLVETGLWTPVQALAMIKFIPDHSRQTEMLAILAPHLPGELLENALTIARVMGDEIYLANTLYALAPHLPEIKRAKVLEEALAATRAIDHEAFRADTLGALAPHLSGDLLGEALAIARAIGNERFRAETLIVLVPCLPGGLLGEALAAARTMKDEHHRADVLGALVPYLPASEQGEVLRETLGVARAIENERFRADALIALVPQLSGDLLREVSAVVRAIENERFRANALIALVPQLSECERRRVLGEALAAARAIKAEDDRTPALRDVAAHLSGPEREGVLGEALVAARAIKVEHYRAPALSMLAPLLSGDLLRDALAAARAIKDEGCRAQVLRVLVSYFPEIERGVVLKEAWAVALAIKGVALYMHALVALVPLLSGDLLGEALAAACAIEDESARANVLIALAPRLSRDLLRETLAVARAIENASIRTSALGALVPYLPENERVQTMQEAVNASRIIGDMSAHANVLVALAQHLPGDLLLEALDAARSIENEIERADTLGALMPHLPESERVQVLGEALAAARSIKDKHHRADALCDLALHLSEHERGEILDEALAAGRSIEERHQVSVLGALVPHLSGSLLREALADAGTIKDEHARARALDYLAPHLSGSLLGEALADARTMKDEHARARALGYLAPYLSDSERVQTLREALTATHALTYEIPRVRALGALAPYLPEHERMQALAEVLHTTRAFKSDPNCFYILHDLAPHLPNELLEEALTAARSIENEYGRAQVLGVLASCLPDYLLGDALTAARAIKNESARARTLGAFAPYLSASERVQVLADALHDASTIRPRSPDSHDDALRDLALRLATWASQQPQRAHLAFTDSLSLLAERPRPDFLDDLTALMPFILALAGDEAPQAAEGIFHAIQEVCAWWP